MPASKILKLLSSELVLSADKGYNNSSPGKGMGA